MPPVKAVSLIILSIGLVYINESNQLDQDNVFGFDYGDRHWTGDNYVHGGFSLGLEPSRVDDEEKDHFNGYEDQSEQVRYFYRGKDNYGEDGNSQDCTKEIYIYRGKDSKGNGGCNQGQEHSEKEKNGKEQGGYTQTTNTNEIRINDEKYYPRTFIAYENTDYNENIDGDSEKWALLGN